VPIHPTVRPLIRGLPHAGGLVFPGIRERPMLKRVKELCGDLKFPNAAVFKLHSFRHHFASLCANHAVAYRKALAWMGHSDSSILQLYYHLTDSDSQDAMNALAGTQPKAEMKPEIVAGEGNLRARGESTIENELQNDSEQALRELFGTITERGGFEPPVRVLTRTTV
jgi:hypothetical protein